MVCKEQLPMHMWLFGVHPLDWGSHEEDLVRAFELERQRTNKILFFLEELIIQHNELG